MMWASHIRIIKSEYAFNAPTAILLLGGPFLIGFLRFIAFLEREREGEREN